LIHLSLCVTNEDGIMLNHLLSDLRYGLRVLAAKPGFTLAAVLTLALGIGANTAVFSVIDGLLLRPMPYEDDSRLVEIYNTYPKNDLINAGDSIPDYLDRRDQAGALADSGLYHRQSYNLNVQGAPERLNGTMATPSTFSTLGVPAALGRVFNDEEGKLGNEHVAVLSFPLWKNVFGGDAGIVGRDVVMNGANYRVVGVMPESFFFPDRKTQLWTSFAFTDEQRSDKQRGWEFSDMVGRLKPGATTEQLDAQMDAIVQRNVERLSQTSEGANWRGFVETSGFTGRSRSLRTALVGDLRQILWLLQALVSCVLLIACANVANLMLTRLSARQKELSVRAALGAGRARIARQLLIESLMLSLLGGLAGLGFAYASIAAISALGLGGASASFTIGIDASVLGYALLLAIGTGLLFALFPLLSMRHGASLSGLKEGGRGNSAGPGAGRLRGALSVVQTAMAVALLGVCGLLIRSFMEVRQQSPGFVSDNILSATIDLPKNRYPDAASQARFDERLLQEARALPGVKSAGLVSNMPFTGNNGSQSYIVEGRDPKEGVTPHGFSQTVDEDFFKTMQIPLLQGRPFSDADTETAPGVAIVDEILVNKYFRGQNPIGKRIAQNYETTDMSKTKWLTIVGVVGTVKHERLSEHTIKETIYTYYKQNASPYTTLALRSDASLSSLVAPLRAALQRVDPEQPVFDIRSMSERIAISLDDRRTPMLLLVGFAGIALALSAVGIYGVLAFAVALRTGEIGVRLSLGADRNDILKLVLRDGGKLIVIGLVLGLVGAIGIAFVMRSQLFGVGVVDPLSLSAVLVLIGGTALFACWLPARRAAKVSPIEALRYE
jgi:predicted permease